MLHSISDIKRYPEKKSSTAPQYLWYKDISLKKLLHYSTATPDIKLWSIISERPANAYHAINFELLEVSATWTFFTRFRDAIFLSTAVWSSFGPPEESFNGSGQRQHFLLRNFLYIWIIVDVRDQCCPVRQQLWGIVVCQSTRIVICLLSY